MTRWLKRTLLAVGLYLVVHTGWLIAEREWRRAAGEREYAEAVAATEEHDPDWRWEVIARTRQRPPADRNGAAVIPQVKAGIPRNWGRKLQGDEWEPVLNRPANLRHPDEVLAEARRELAAARPAVELAFRLKDYPLGHRDIALTPDVVNTPLPDTQNTREVAVLLRWAVAVAVEDGDGGRAADGLYALLNASRSLGDEPFLISQLVRMATRTVAARAAERTLAQTELPADRLAALQAAWAADAEEPLFMYAVRGERASWDVLMENLARGVVGLHDVSGSPGDESPFGTYAWWLYRGRLPRNRAFVHRWLGDAVAAARLPLHEQPVPIRRLDETLPDKNDKDYIIARMLMPAVDRVAEAGWRTAADARCVAVGLACERYRLARGRWPDALADLPPDLLPGGVPLDPFDGQPLRYRRLADGVAVYSLGADRADDGGNVDRAARPNTPGTDVVFRLWDEGHRRRPAPPDPPAAEGGQP